MIRVRRRYRIGPESQEALDAAVARATAELAARAAGEPAFPMPKACRCGCKDLETVGFKHPRSNHRAWRCKRCTFIGPYRLTDRERAAAWNEEIDDIAA